MQSKSLTALMYPFIALALAACDSDSKSGNNVAGGEGCDAVIPMQVTGELTPMYSWEDGDVNSLTVARVENLEFIAANPAECAATATPPESCELAYVRSSLPDPAAPATPRNNVATGTLHGSTPSFGGGIPSEVATTAESPLENGVQYQASVVRSLEDGSVACGCVRFNAGTAASDDDNCL